jgi:hypothetical protein
MLEATTTKRKRHQHRNMPMDRYLSVSDDFAEFDLTFAKNEKGLSGLFFANVDFSSEGVLAALRRLEGHEYRKVTLFNPTGTSLDRALAMILSDLRVDTFVLEYTTILDAGGDEGDDGTSAILRDRENRAIGDALRNGSPVKSLCFKGVPRWKSLAKALKAGLSQSQHLESFVWSHRRGVAANLDVESSNSNDNVRAFWKTLSQGLESCRSLNRVEIRQPERDEVTAELLMSLRNHPALRHMTICVYSIGSEIEHALGYLCESQCMSAGNSGDGPPLQTIKIRIRGQPVSVPALPSNGRIKYMLEPWFVCDEHMEVLGAGLSRNNAIDELDLRYHSLSCRGIQTLASWLPRAGMLRRLILEGLVIKEEGAATLLTSICANHEWLEGISLPLSCPYRRQIQHYADLNRAGNTKLRRDPDAPLALWPLVLARADKLAYNERYVKENKLRQANALYQLLHGPATFGRLQTDRPWSTSLRVKNA